jgi:hypothetical protein
MESSMSLRSQPCKCVSPYGRLPEVDINNPRVGRPKVSTIQGLSELIPADPIQGSLWVSKVSLADGLG